MKPGQYVQISWNHIGREVHWIKGLITKQTTSVRENNWFILITHVYSWHETNKILIVNDANLVGCTVDVLYDP